MGIRVAVAPRPVAAARAAARHVSSTAGRERRSSSACAYRPCAAAGLGSPPACPRQGRRAAASARLFAQASPRRAIPVANSRCAAVDQARAVRSLSRYPQNPTSSERRLAINTTQHQFALLAGANPVASFEEPACVRRRRRLVLVLEVAVDIASGREQRRDALRPRGERRIVVWGLPQP